MFKKKRIGFDTVGEIFEYERLRQKHTQEYVAEKIQVDVLYIIALEERRYEELPASVYAKHFVRSYIKFLELDEQLLYRFERELRLLDKKQNTSKLFKVPEGTFISLPYFLRVFGGLLVIILFLGYIAYSIYNVLSPPSLTILYPKDDILLHRQYLEVLGSTESNSRVEINGEDVFVDLKGDFDDKFALQPGLNIISISAGKKYSKKNTVIRRVVVVPF